MFILNLVSGVRSLIARATRGTSRIHRAEPVTSTAPKVTYEFNAVLATGNQVCIIMQEYLSGGLDLEILFRAIHTQEHTGIIRTVTPNRNKTYTHTPSSHTLIINNESQIIDYSPK
ncbi:MAG: hypothetical protein A3B68_01535 [Candidatus Melainabacteria bacterium RIFCSPHIGHO2_02_FULL_34_12]|nr:MAG: hypothetical protein A3B68_01535 [Candidatus Melainabacteria bacterium RIFCSPHIGHO2_02_FULL_34_12]